MSRLAWYWRLSLVAKTMLLVFIAMIIVGTYWWTTRSVVGQVARDVAMAEEAAKELRLIAELDQATLEAQSNLRGYFLARDPLYRTDYKQAVLHFADRVSELQPLLQGNVGSLGALMEADSLWGEWLRYFADPTIEAINAARNADLSPELFQINASNATLSQVRSRLAIIRGYVERDGATIDSLGLMRRHYRSVIVLNLLTVVLVVIFFYAFARRLTMEVQTLICGAETVARGKVGFELPSVDTPELAKVVDHFNAMSRALLKQAEELRLHHEQLLAQNEKLVQGQRELTKVKAEVEEERDNMATLNSLVTRSQASRSLRDLCEQILESLMAHSNSDVGAFIIREGGGQGYVAAQVGLTEAAAQEERVRGLMAEAIRNNRVIVASYPDGGLRRPVFTTEVPVHQEAYLPITYAGMPLAVVMLGTTRAAGIRTYSGTMLRATADTLGAVMANRLSYDRLSEAYEQLRVRKQEITNLTESVVRERDEAAQKRDLLQAVLNSTGEGIFVGLSSVNRHFFNAHFFRLLELPTPPESATLSEVIEMAAPTLAKLGVLEMIQELRRSKEEIYSARLLYVGVARRSFEWTSAPVRHTNGAHLGRVFVLRDITQEVESERLKEEFISTVSHELRTPLTSIRGYLELLIEGDLGEISADQRDVLEVMNQNAGQLLTLINDLLEVEKLTRGRLALECGPVNAGELLQRSVRMAEQSARAKGLALQTEIAPSLPTLQGDEGRLVQVFTNLLSNAIKYTKEGSVLVRAWQEGDAVRIAFQDTGIGISPENQAKLFERFFRVDNAYTREVGGIGLGLPITKELVERHGGSLTVESEAGRGSTFTVTLPVPEGGER